MEDWGYNVLPTELGYLNVWCKINPILKLCMLYAGLPADLKNLKKTLKFGFCPKKPKISQNELK